MRKSLHNLTRQKNSSFENVTEGCEGFQSLANDLEKYMNNAENVTEVLEVGAKEFVADVKKLPKPISRIRKASYTHLVRSFTYETQGKEVVAGWGKYYGPMVENGSRVVVSNKYMKKRGKKVITGNSRSAKAHVKPLWNRNKEKYYKKMITKLGLQTW